MSLHNQHIVNKINNESESFGFPVLLIVVCVVVMWLGAAVRIVG